VRNRYVIEVAAETPDDAATAAAGGADRIELSAGLDLGGLTPSVGLFEEARAATKLPVVVMIRPRSGDFVYADAEVRVMARDVETFRPLGPAGFVFGALRADGTPDREACEYLRERAGTVPCVFHRAFDKCPDPAAALDELIDLGFARVMTSGGESTALAGAPAIAELNKVAHGRIELLPCGRVRSSNAENLLRFTHCTQIHSSFGEPVPESPDRGRRGYQQRTRVGAADLAATRALLDRLALEWYG
jgi:copper homeostasis protein CutC